MKEEKIIKKQGGKVLDFQEAYLKKLYLQDLIVVLDIAIYEKTFAELDNPLVTLTKQELIQLLESYGQDLVDAINKVEHMIKKPKEIEEQLVTEESEEYIDDNFNIYTKPKEEVDEND